MICWFSLGCSQPTKPDKTLANFVSFQHNPPNWELDRNHDDDDNLTISYQDILRKMVTKMMTMTITMAMTMTMTMAIDLLKKSNLSSHSVLLWSIQGDSMWEKEGEHSVFALSM